MLPKSPQPAIDGLRGIHVVIICYRKPIAEHDWMLDFAFRIFCKPDIKRKQLDEFHQVVSKSGPDGIRVRDASLLRRLVMQMVFIVPNPKLDCIETKHETKREESENSDKWVEVGVVFGHWYEIMMLENSVAAKVYPSRVSVHWKRLVIYFDTKPLVGQAASVFGHRSWPAMLRWRTKKVSQV